jgi:hypothetical protein
MQKEEDAPTVAGEQRARYAFLMATTVLVIITGLVMLRSGLGVQELTGLAVVWVILGYASYFSASQAYGPKRTEPRPYLVVGRGIPAWGFFLVGSVFLSAVAFAWISLGRYETGGLLAGIALAYACMTFPRPLSLRRAGLSGVGLLISSVALILF